MFEGKFFLAAALTAVLSYLIGSVSFAIIVSRLGAQEDVRNYGSGNAGMTNILRNYGKKMAAFTAVGDFGKALVAVALGRLIFRMLGVEALDGGYIAGLFRVPGGERRINQLGGYADAESSGIYPLYDPFAAHCIPD